MLSIETAKVFEPLLQPGTVCGAHRGPLRTVSVLINGCVIDPCSRFQVRVHRGGSPGTTVRGFPALAFGIGPLGLGGPVSRGAIRPFNSMRSDPFQRDTKR